MWPFAGIERRLTFKPNAVQYRDLTHYPVAFFDIAGPSGKINALTYRGNSSYVVLLSHGNTGNITFPFWHYDFLIAQKISFVAYDYPGYGLSEGIPSEKSLFESSLCIYEWVAEHFQANTIFLYGLSLGGAVSIELAVKKSCAGMIIESPFVSSRAIGRHLLRGWPLDMFVPNRFRNIEKIAKIHTPLLIIHGSDDPTVPVAMGEILFNAAKEPKELLIVPGAGHADVAAYGGTQYQEKVLTFFKTYETHTR